MERDKNRIAFITCVNNEEAYTECQYYLKRLHVPDGLYVDIIAVREAESMAAGYNAGMKRSNAKYKVYLHQDVFVKNINFIDGLLRVFSSDTQVGLIGMLGNSGQRLKDNSAIMKWDTGKIVDHTGSTDFAIPAKVQVYADVWAVDGLLLATQYDIRWREEVFEGWDFYDISQCMEFKKAGYKVVVPWQETAWCYHDCIYIKLIKYFDYYERFLREYSELEHFPIKEKDPDMSAYREDKRAAQAKEELREEIEALFIMEKKDELRKIFQSPQLQNLIFLKEYETIVWIDWLEEQNRSGQRFWGNGETIPRLLRKLQMLKYALKRIEYDVADNQEEDWIKENYSKCAVVAVCAGYVVCKDKVYKKLKLLQELS